MSNVDATRVEQTKLRCEGWFASVAAVAFMAGVTICFLSFSGCLKEDRKLQHEMDMKKLELKPEK